MAVCQNQRSAYVTDDYQGCGDASAQFRIMYNVIGQSKEPTLT
jgi:hypothetical protein